MSAAESRDRAIICGWLTVVIVVMALCGMGLCGWLIGTATMALVGP